MEINEENVLEKVWSKAYLYGKTCAKEIHAPKPSRDTEMMEKTFYIKTFGCQMNTADTERMSALLRDKGMRPAEGVEGADLILINGCSVREKAVHKAVSALGTYQDLKKQSGQKPLIGLGGCVGQLDKGAIFSRAPYLDFVFGPDAIDQLPEIVQAVESGERHSVYTEFTKDRDYSTETKVFGNKAQAFVNIMKGCDKFCTYCIVPFTRGREKSRTVQEVVDDCARLVSIGIKEITLLGQNVNSFGKGNPNTQQREPKSLSNIIGKVGPREGEENFPQLLRALDEDPRMEGLKRIRFTSSHPLDFSDQLIECYHPVSGVKKLANHLHLPVQSGSNRVLQKMGRHHKIENYVAQMDRLREIRPDVGISTDIIVGFPGETLEEYQETLSLLDRIQYDSIYAFAYSPRPGTRASKLEDDVSDQEKNRRLNEILAHQMKISAHRYQARVGQEMEILVEGVAKNQAMAKNGQRVWTGRTSCMRVVNFVTESPRDFSSKFVQVRISGATALSLIGEFSLQDFEDRGNQGLSGESVSSSPSQIGAAG